MLIDIFQTNRCSRDGYGEWDRPTALSGNFPAAYSLHNFSSIYPTDAEKKKIRKAKHTQPWDIKKEREHEAANPGPSISEALKQGRPAAWTDPSEKKERRTREEDAKRRKIWKPLEFSDDEEMMPPMIGGEESSDDELIEDQGEERTG